MTDNKKILDVIPKSRDKALTIEPIADQLGVTTRQARHLIEIARKSGCLICNDSNGKGYYLAESHEDLKNFIYPNIQRIKSTWISLNPAIKELKQIEGQLSIDDINAINKALEKIE